MRLQLPAAVNMIIDVLQAHGYEDLQWVAVFGIRC